MMEKTSIYFKEQQIVIRAARNCQANFLNALRRDGSLVVSTCKIQAPKLAAAFSIYD
jgi:hypothetical protein